MALGGKLEVTAPEVAKTLGVNLAGGALAGASVESAAADPTAPSVKSDSSGPLTVDQMKSNKYKLEARGVVKGAKVTLAGAVAGAVYEVTDVTDAVVDLADARAAIKATVGAASMEPKTLDSSAELEKRTLTVANGFKPQVARPPCGVDLAGWDSDIAVGICMRAMRTAHDQHCKVNESIAILDTPLQVYLTGARASSYSSRYNVVSRVVSPWASGYSSRSMLVSRVVSLWCDFAMGVELQLVLQGDTKFKKGELTLVATSTKFITNAAGAAWAGKAAAAVDIGTITLPSSAVDVAVMPHIVWSDKVKAAAKWVTPYWCVPTADSGNMKMSTIEVAVTDGTATHTLNVPSMVNTKEVKPGATTTTTTLCCLRSLTGDQIKLQRPPKKGEKRKR